jgi:tetratricopeptide (TPR) repeat protein
MTTSATPAVTDLRNRHLDFYLDLARQAEAGMKGEDVEPWIELFEAEEDNFRTALRWAIDSGRIDDGADLAFGITDIWWHKRRGSEAIGWCEQLLSRADGSPRARGKAALLLTMYVHNMGDYELAAARATEAAESFRDIGDDHLLGVALGWLGWARWYGGKPSEGMRHMQEAVELLRTADDPQQLAEALRGWGWCLLSSGDAEGALAKHDEALAVLRPLGNRSQLAEHLQIHANIHSNLGNTAETRRLYEEAVDLTRQMGDRRGVGYLLLNLTGLLVDWPGDLALAEELIGERLRIAHDLEQLAWQADALRELAVVARYRRDLPLAAQLLDDALAASHRITAPDEFELFERAMIFAGLAQVAVLEGDTSSARTHLREAATLARRQGFARTRVRAMRAIIAITEDIDRPQALALYEELASFLAASEEALWESVTTGAGADVARLEGDTAAALAASREAVDQARAAGAPFGTVAAHLRLGSLLLEAGDRNEARATLEEALPLAANTAAIRAHVLEQLAAVTVAQGDIASAERFVRDLGSEWRRLDSPRVLCRLVEMMAGIAISRDRADEAARACGAAEYDRRTLHAPRTTDEDGQFAVTRDAAETALGREAYRAEYEEGVRLGATSFLAALLG